VTNETSVSSEIGRWRAETPGCAHVAHLNNAGAALMPEPVLSAMADHLALEARMGGYEAADAASAGIEAAYAAVAALIGAPRASVAFVENATVGVALALGALDPGPGDAVLTTRADYASHHLMLLSLARRRGVEILLADDRPEGGVDPDSVRRHLRTRRCAAMVATWIPTSTGLVQDLAAVGVACADAGVAFVVDACQAVGQLPIDVDALRCDFLTASARKFLRGPRGIGFLYVSPAALERGAAPLHVDMRGATWSAPGEYVLADGARRFENWEFNYGLVLGLGAAARYANDIGVERCSERAAALAARARERLAALPGARVLDRGARLSAIVAVAFADRDAHDLVRALRKRRVHTSALARESAVIQLDAAGAESALRISPHYYNTEAEVDAAVEALADVLG
jgi:selenocysteine lyase/cysteine desulfurase